MSASLLAYRPDPVVLPDLVRRDELDPLTWTGMLRDGALVHLWHDAAMRADVRPTPALRLAALGSVVPRRGVVGRAAAVWVHAGGPAPARIDVLVSTGRRRTDPHPLRRAVEARLPDEDVMALGDGHVTTVQRTGVDLARWAEPEEAHRLLVGLLPHGFDPDAALASLDVLPGERNVRRARAVLGRLPLEARMTQARMTGWSGVRAPVMR